MQIKKQQGFSLIEVMVTTFIVVVGVLGITSVQVASLKNNQSAYFRSQANFLVAGMLDRMRANTTAYDNGLYNNVDTSGTLVADPACSTAPSGCGLAPMAAHDIRQWMLNFSPHTDNPLIPGAKGVITTDTASGVGGTGDVTITITWDESVNQAMREQTVSVTGRI